MSTFRAESPGEVFLLATHYLHRRLKDIPEDKWEEFILSYDNMCNVCKMHCAQEPLPLEPPFDTMWLKITKVIDRLHLITKTSIATSFSHLKSLRKITLV